MLSEDEILRGDLNLSPDFKPDSFRVLKDIKSWCKSRNAVTYAVILSDRTTVGTISLSHINNEEKTARIGYWIGSSYRSRGYCSIAFGLVANKAVEMGISKLISTIAEENINSKRVWDKHGGCVTGSRNGKSTYELVCSYSPYST